MRLLGNTKIYGVRLIDLDMGLDFNISATVKDLYDTISESGDKVKIYLLSPGGITKSDSYVKVKSVDKDDKYSGSIYRFRDIPCGIIEKVMPGSDASIYCSGDTRLNLGGFVQKVCMLKISNMYDVQELDLENPDMYSITLDSFSDGGNIIRSSIDINGIEVMIN